MKNAIFIVLSTLFAISVQAQTLTSYKCDFESAAEMQNWTLNAGPKGATSINKWMRGSDVSFGLSGQNGFYVSADSATSGYDGTNGGFIVAYRPMTLQAGTYTLMFDWILQGQSADGIYVGWVDAATNTNSNWSKTSVGVPNWLPGHAVKQGGSSHWQTYSTTFTASGNPGKIIVVFYYSKANPITPGPAIDNIEIFQGGCVAPSGVRYDGNTVSLGWNGNTAAWYDVLVFNGQTGGSTSYTHVTSNNCSLSQLSEEGMYYFYVRANCDSVCHSTWSYTSKFVWIKGARCIDFLDLTSDNSGAAKCYHTANCSFSNLYEQSGQIDYGNQADNSRHTIHYEQGETDPRTNNGLRTVPKGEIASVRLNGWTSSCHASTIEYDYTVQAGVSDLLILQYACVLENPSHLEPEQPRFKLDILQNNVVIDPCAQCDFKAGFGGAASWHHVNPGSYDQVDWCDWQTVTVSLRNYIGATLKIRLTAYDCTQSGHYGYAYFTLNCAAGDLQGISCGDYALDHFQAPEGFNYRWYKETNPSVILSDSSVLQVSKTDTCTYMVDLISKANPQCYYSLVANPNPRGPKAKSTFQKFSKNCENKAVFTNESFVARTNRQTGRTVKDTTETISSVRWIFGDGTPDDSTSMLAPVTHYYPATGGVFHAMLIVGMSGDVCEDTLRMDMQFPNILAADTDPEVLRSCDSTYTDTKGRIWTAPSDGSYIVDTLAESINRYGCTAPNYRHVYLNTTFDTLYTARICDGGSYLWAADGKQHKNDKVVYETTDYEFVHTLKTVQGCDSVMRLKLTVDPSLDVDFDADTFYVCPDSGKLYIGYDLKRGIVEDVVVYMDAAAQAQGFNPSYKFGVGEPISIKLPTKIVPNNYNASIDFSSELCPSDPKPVIVQLMYPSSVLVQKNGGAEGGFISLLNADYNGGYSFGLYQWFRNGVPVTGGTSSYLAVDQEDEGSEFYLMLVREGEVIPFFTCPIIYGKPTGLDEIIAGENASQKVWYDGSVYIYSHGQWYNQLGQRVNNPIR